MDLFVINRYREESENVNLEALENEHLQKLKQKIDERKKLHKLQETSDAITLKQESPYTENISSQNLYSKIPINSSTECTLNLPVNFAGSSNDKPVTFKADKSTTEFKVLGIKGFEKKEKVQRVLPYWLSHPYNIPLSLQNLTGLVEEQSWLHPTLKATLLNEGCTHLFPVQEKVIPFIIKQHKKPCPFWPSDVCVSAPTGSGKTLSFVLPIIQILMDDIKGSIRALIVLPVQELAMQVANVFKKYCAKTGLKVALLSGSVPLRQEQQQIVKYTESLGWTSNIDIIVCTAGRLVEHLHNTEGFCLRYLKFLVIDEADRIMDHIQNDWVYHLDKHIKTNNESISGKMTQLSWKGINAQKPPPHKLLFSATLSQDPEKLEQWGLFQPVLFSSAEKCDFEHEVDIRKYTTPEELIEESVICNAEEKPLVLYHFLIEQNWDKVLCFTNAAQSSHRLTILLNIWGKGKIKVAELSAALDRQKRDEVLKKFTNSEINVLISTDALARGIDIPHCNYVISYDPPRHIKTYIHRVGRTGRAGRVGHAVTMLLPNQLHLFNDLLKSGAKNNIPKIKVEQAVYDRLTENYAEALRHMKNSVQEELNSKVKKSIGLKRKKTRLYKGKKSGSLDKKPNQT